MMVHMKLIALLVLLAQLSCTSTTATCQDPKNASSVECVVVGAVVDCTGVSSLASAVAVVGPIVDNLLSAAIQADGTIAWAGIEPQLVTLGLQYGMCVIAEIWNNYVNGVPPRGIGSGSALVAHARIVPTDLAAEFDRIRAKVAPGRKFKTARGTL